MAEAKTEIDPTHEDYVGGYNDALKDRYSPPISRPNWFMYQAGWQAGLKHMRFTRLLEGKPARQRW